MSDWLEAERRAERAQQLCESQRWAEALAELDVALSINPNNATWHAHRGFLLEELGRFSEAVEAFEESLEREPDDPDVGLALGEALMRLARPARAIEIFENVSRSHPDFEPALCRRIEAYAEIGQHERAEEVFYLAQQLDESCPHCFYHMGTSLAARGLLDRALFCWRKVLQLDLDYAGVNQQMARAFRVQGDLKSAREFLLREVRGDPGNTELLFELAELTWEAGELGAAAAKFSQIVELDPEYAEAHYALGRLWLTMGQPAQAAACFETVVRLGDSQADLPDFDLKFAEALLSMGRYRDARQRLQAAPASSPEDTRATLLLGDCLLAEKKLEQAADAYRRVLAHNANNFLVQHKLGACLLGLNRIESALDHVHLALREKPDFVPAMFNATVAHMRLGHWRQAKALLRRAIQQEPGNQRLRTIYRQFWRYRIRHYVRRWLRRPAPGFRTA